MNQRPHKKLNVYSESLKTVHAIYHLSKSLPDDERFGLCSQLRRAAVSIPLNIAEGAARKSKKEFSQFLYISSASISELDAILDILIELDYITLEAKNIVALQLDRLSAMLSGLIKSIKSD